MTHPCDLPPTSELLSEVGQHIGTAATVQWVDVTGSTNTDVLMLLRAGVEALPPTRQCHRPIVLGSRLQTTGRGQHGRRWEASAGQAILMSIGWHCKLPFPGLGLTALTLGHAALDALQASLPNETVDHLKLKWPNDLQIDDRKLGGILVETVARGQDLLVVAGIGINLRAPEQLSAALQRPLASWCELSPSTPASDLIGRLIQQWLSAFSKLRQLKDHCDPTLPDRHRPRDALRGRPIKIVGRTDELAYLAEGIDESGHLLLRSANGASERLAQGSVQLAD